MLIKKQGKIKIETCRDFLAKKILVCPQICPHILWCDFLSEIFVDKNVLILDFNAGLYSFRFDCRF